MVNFWLTKNICSGFNLRYYLRVKFDSEKRGTLRGQLQSQVVGLGTSITLR